MTPDILIALIGIIPSLIAAAAAIYSVRVSQGNRKVVDHVATEMGVVRAQTNGLLAKMTDAAEAKGVLAGVKQEQDNPTKQP